MSQENVEIVRATFEAWNEGDMNRLRESLDPEVVMRSPEGWPEPGPFVGRDAVMRQYEQMRDTWDADAAEPVEFIDAGGRVVGQFVWRGMGQGPETDIAASSVVTMRDGKILGIEYFWDHAKALEAAGLSE